jgi:alcohol dehydrogenase YqhD (iron-dependent ADH family)
MQDFTFHNPTKIIFGRNSMDQITRNAAQFGRKIVLAAGGGSIRRNGIYQTVMEQLQDFEVAEFWGIEPNPRVSTLRNAIALCKQVKPDLILAVGGGSVVDASKLIAAGAVTDLDAWELVSAKIYPPNPLPLASVLTLSATGSEMNNGGVITNLETMEKKPYHHPDCYPRFSILDPQNTFSVPANQTAYGIVDIFSHVLEQYLNQDVNAPLQDRFSEGILLTVRENGPRALRKPDDYDARANLMWASTLALNGLIGAGVPSDWATHGIEHEISAFYDIPHAAGLAIITPRWMQVVFEQKLPKFVQYGQRTFGLPTEGETCARQAIQETYDFFASLGIKMHLRDWGISDQHFPVMVERLAGKIGETPLTADQIHTILTACL